MTRMGHANPRAALIYQHASAEADLAMAAASNKMVEATTSADATPAGSTRTSPDDDDEAGGGALAGLGNGTGRAHRPIPDADGRCLQR